MKFRILFLVLALLSIAAHVGQAGPGYVVYWGLGGDVKRGPMEWSAGVLTKDGLMISNAVTVATGRFHALAVLNDGTVVGWGGNLYEQAVGEKTTKPQRPLDFVKTDGYLLTNVTTVAAGWWHSLALTKDGKLVGWGRDDNSGTPVRIPEGLSNLRMIASGERYRAGVNRAGEVIDLYSGIAIPGLTNMLSVAIPKTDHPLAIGLKSDGTMIQFANRGFGNATNMPLVSNVVSVACGKVHDLALLRDGRVWGWGLNGMGQATGIASTESPRFSSALVQVNGRVLDHVTAIAAADEYSLALKDDGTVVNWGNARNRGYAIPSGLSNVVAIACGGYLNVAITTNVAVAELFRMAASP